MILLIGGSSHVGKTLLAQKLLEKLKMPYLSLDHLKMGLIRAGMTDLTVEDDLKLRYAMWPLVREIIKTAIENKQNLILEGCYIPETWREGLEQSYLDEIRCAFIVMSENYLRTHFDALVAHADDIEHRRDDRPDLERLILCSQGFKEDCIEYGIPYLEIDGEYDVQALTQELMRLLGLTDAD